LKKKILIAGHPVTASGTMTGTSLKRPFGGPKCHLMHFFSNTYFAINLRNLKNTSRGSEDFFSYFTTTTKKFDLEFP